MSFSVSWQNVKYNEGAWAQMTAEVRKTRYPIARAGPADVLRRRSLQLPDGVDGGALESGRQVATAIHTRGRRSAKAVQLTKARYASCIRAA